MEHAPVSPRSRRLPSPRALALLAALTLVPPAALAFGSTHDYRSNSTQTRAQAASVRAVADPSVRFAVSGVGMTTALGVAKAYWGTTACGGQFQIAWTGLDPDINATSTWSNPTSAYGNPTQNSDCSIALNRDVPFDWPMFCTVIVHEYGHLTGHQHVSDPNNVMTPVYTHALAQCAQTPDPTAPAVAPTVVVPRPGPQARPARVTHHHRRAKARRRTRRRGLAIVAGRPHVVPVRHRAGRRHHGGRGARRRQRAGARHRHGTR